MAKLREKIIFPILSVIITLLFLELFARLSYPWIKNYDTEMWRYAVNGKVPVSHEGRIFHMNKPGAYFKNLYGVEVKINSKGLRDYEYSYAKPPDTYRILVLGDSITFGWGVEIQQTYAKILEDKLNRTNLGRKFQVINTGVGNYSTETELDFLKMEGLKYKPDMIILGYFINDAENIRPESKYFLNRQSYLYVYLWSKFLAAKARLSPKGKYTDYYLSLYRDSSPEKKAFENAVSRLKYTSKRENIPLVVLIIPDLHEFNSYPFSAVDKYVEDLFKGYTLIKPLSGFDRDINSSQYWVSREDAHPNEKAHRVIAEALYPAIASSVY